VAWRDLGAAIEDRRGLPAQVSSPWPPATVAFEVKGERSIQNPVTYTLTDAIT